MHLNNLYLALLFVCTVIIPTCLSAKSANPVIDNISDIKDFKKLLRTKNNILVTFVGTTKKASPLLKVFREAAQLIKGEGTMVVMDCTSGEAKKLCKKLKVSPEDKGYLLKHYKDGEFHKDYDRKETVPAMLNFMRDPSGEVPWDEDDSASDIHHLADVQALLKLVRRQSLPIMVMFYAPWCGFCKQMKPDYVAAAKELKGEAIMAAIDVNRPENSIVRSQFNITGFPTLLFFENGSFKLTYEGENKKDALVRFMKDPQAPPPKPVDVPWSESSTEIVHLTDGTFDSTLAESDSALVLFYAPWCGHCKRIKPEYEKAAAKLKTESIKGMLAAVDATVEREVGKRFSIKGYPTLKYFVKGELQYDVSVRDEPAIVNFMKDPREPPPPPPPEAAWHEQPSDILHLTVDDFKTTLRKKKHALVMFYAPWCGHCKKAKPEYTAAAEKLRDDPRVALAAIDCTAHSSVCSAYDVSGYPTIKLFNYLNKSDPKEYSGGRTTADFLKFMAPFTSVDVNSPSSKPKEEL